MRTKFPGKLKIGFSSRPQIRAKELYTIGAELAYVSPYHDRARKLEHRVFWLLRSKKFDDKKSEIFEISLEEAIINIKMATEKFDRNEEIPGSVPPKKRRARTFYLPVDTLDRLDSIVDRHPFGHSATKIVDSAISRMIDLLEKEIIRLGAAR